MQCGRHISSGMATRMETRPKRRSRWQTGRRIVPAALVCLAACATGRRGPQALTPPDLSGAREALSAACAAGAEQELPEVIARSQGHLGEAEEALAAGDGPSLQRAGWLARLAETEATTAAALTERLRAEHRERDEQIQQLNRRAERANAERQSLEARIEMLVRDLDFTETEIIRTKARLKGLASRAEASSAMAEATILVRRVSAEHRLGDTVPRCRELIQQAEEQFRHENYGAATFFALKAQELLGPRSRTTTRSESSPGPGMKEPPRH
jgi:hypothetical protein